MIRPFTVLCALLAAGSGLYLYHEKHRASVLDRQIAQVVKAADAARERTGMLRAEWTLLNEPERLQELAARYLTQLQPMAPSQFVQIAALDGRLPPVPQPPAAPPEEASPAVAEAMPPPSLPAPAPMAVAAVTPDRGVAAPATDPGTAAAAPAVRMADAVVGPPARSARPTPPHEANPRRKPVVAAGFQTGPSAQPRPLPTRQVMAPIVDAFAIPRPMQINRPATMQRAEAVAPVMTGSVLGGGRPMLAPPVPFGGGG